MWITGGTWFTDAWERLNDGSFVVRIGVDLSAVYNIMSTENNIWMKFRINVRKIAVFPFVALIKFYRVCISPLKPPCCRFTPTCSEYALQAFRKHGPFKGLILTVWRLLRCNPWGGSGYDPVP